MTPHQFCSHETDTRFESTGAKFREFKHAGDVAFRYRLIGHGQTLVVLDAGYRSGATAWATVSPQVASFGRVLVIDRSPASGGSSSDPAIALDCMAEHLGAFIDNAGPGERLVLAGWGFGALVVQALAAREVESISGMVLIDPSPVPTLEPETSRNLLDLRQDEYPHPELLEELRGHSLGHHASSQLLHQQDSGEIPVTVIMPGTQPEPDDALGQHWLDLQQGELRRFHRLREIIAGRSRTAIPRERPDVVVDAIQRYCLPAL